MDINYVQILQSDRHLGEKWSASKELPKAENVEIRVFENAISSRFWGFFFWLTRKNGFLVFCKITLKHRKEN